MKIQDIGFILVLVIALVIHKPKVAAGIGLFCLVVSLPLFAKHIFFTAERLTWYAAGFFLVSILLFLYQLKKAMIKK